MSDRSRSALRAFFQPFLLIIIASFVARASLVQAFSIPSASMMPTLEPGDHVVVTPYNPLWRDSAPQRGDVIVFRSSVGPDGYLIKRVVGLPGDTIEIRHGLVWINGRRLSEPYLRTRSHDEMLPRVLPPGRYFVLGDARNNSDDSRSWGYLDRKMILGKARLIFWSDGHRSSSVSSGRAVRWSRLFRPVN